MTVKTSPFSFDNETWFYIEGLLSAAVKLKVGLIP